LTGERATDVADASGTLLLDVANRRWSKEILELVQMDESLLPALYGIARNLRPNFCWRLGRYRLQQGTPVVAGAGDQAAGAIGMGIVSEGAVSATTATSGVSFRSHGSSSARSSRTLAHFCHAVPGRWMVMGVTQAAGLSLRWFSRSV